MWSRLSTVTVSRDFVPVHHTEPQKQLLTEHNVFQAQVLSELCLIIRNYLNMNSELETFAVTREVVIIMKLTLIAHNKIKSYLQT